MNTCAFVPCAETTPCVLVGGCVERRFGKAPVKTMPELKADARALAGTKPATITRRRRALR